MSAEPREPEVVEGEMLSIADVMPRPLQYPPAVRHTCACGKDGSPESHGFNPETGHWALTCAEVRQIRARVEASPRQEAREAARRPWLLALGVLAGAASAAGLTWLLVVGVTSLVSAVVAWLSANWLGIAAVAVVLVLLFAGGAKCAGIHCGGCRG